MSFIYTPDIDANKYNRELVKILPNTPRNPADYHDLQDIIRHRQVRLVDELYGECRIATNNTNPFTLIGTTTKQIRVNGVWYLDGYRVLLDNITCQTPLVNATDYYIFLTLRFVELNYNDDPTIALRDPSTGKFIETSTRYEFEKEIVLVENTGGEPSLEVIDKTTYLLGHATWNTTTSTWGLFDDMATIDVTYSDAIDNIVNSVKRAIDEGTPYDMEVPLFGSDSEIKATRIHSRESNLKFTNVIGKDLMVLSVSELGDGPKIVLNPDTETYPVLRLTHEGMLGFDEFDNNASYRYNGISLNNYSSRFELDGFRCEYIYADQPGISIIGSARSSTIHTAPITIDVSTDVPGSSVPDSGYEKFMLIDNTIEGNTGVYTFTLNRADVPFSKIIRVNHIIKTISHSIPGYTDAVVKVNAYWIKDDEPGIERFISTNSYPLIAPERIVSTHLDLFCPATAGGAGSYVNVTFKLVYTVENQPNSNTVAQIGVKIGSNTYWQSQTSPFPLTEIKYLKLGNNLIWADSANRIRVKDISAGGDILNGTDGSPSYFSTDNAGKALFDNDLPFVVQSIIQNPITVPDPNDVIQGPVYDQLTNTVTIPAIETVANPLYRVQAGTISTNQYLGIWEQFASIQRALDRTLPPLASNILFVSPSFVKPNTNEEFGYPYFSKIQSAIDYLNIHPSTFANNTVIVYPGDYYEDIVLANDFATDICNISILATDPTSTTIYGSVVDYINDTKSAIGSINIKIIKADGTAVVTRGQYTNLTFLPNGLIKASGNNGIPVDCIKGKVTIKCDIISEDTNAANAVKLGSDASAVVSIMDSKLTVENLIPIAVSNNNLYLSNVTIAGTGADYAIDSTDGVATFNIHAIRCSSVKYIRNVTITNLNSIIISGTDINFADNLNVV